MDHERLFLVSDPIHGQLAISPLEARLLDTTPMRRLGGMRQLGSADLVYPSATHSRLMHSLGVCSIASRILMVVQKSGESVVALDGQVVQAVRIAALLHDVGHLPFGHALDSLPEVRQERPRALRLAEVLESSDVATILRSESATLHALVAGLLLPHQYDLPNALTPLTSLIDGPLDADRFDYLVRDTRSVGVAMSWDDARLLNRLSLTASGLAVNTVHHDQRRLDVIAQLLDMLTAEHQLFERILFHRTVLAAGAMLSASVARGVASGDLSVSDLERQTDYSLLHVLEGLRDDRANSLARAFHERHLFILTCQVSPFELGSGIDPDAFARQTGEAIQAACKSSRVPASHVIYRLVDQGELPPVGEELVRDVGDVVTPLRKVDFGSQQVPKLVSAMRHLAGIYIFVAPQSADQAGAFTGALMEEMGQPRGNIVRVQVRPGSSRSALALLLPAGVVGYPREPNTYDVPARCLAILDAAAIAYRVIR